MTFLTIISRREAKALGLINYFTGNPCKHGHIARRQTLTGVCRACRTLANRAWRKKNPERVKQRNKDSGRAWRLKNKEKQREQVRQWRLANPEKNKAWQRRHRLANPERYKESRRRQYLKNPADRRERARKWKIANREYASNWHKKYMVEYRKKNAEYVRTQARNRDAQKRGNGGKHTIADLREIFFAQRGRCAYCRSDLKKVKQHVDHIVPLSKGGTNDRRNIQLLCVGCNLRKASRDPFDVMRAMGRLL